MIFKVVFTIPHFACWLITKSSSFFFYNTCSSKVCSSSDVSVDYEILVMFKELTDKQWCNESLQTAEWCKIAPLDSNQRKDKYFIPIPLAREVTLILCNLTESFPHNLTYHIWTSMKGHSNLLIHRINYSSIPLFLLALSYSCPKFKRNSCYCYVCLKWMSHL